MAKSATALATIVEQDLHRGTSVGLGRSRSRRASPRAPRTAPPAARPTRIAVTVETVSWTSPRTLTRIRVSSGKPGSARIAATRPRERLGGARPLEEVGEARPRAPAGPAATQVSTRRPTARRGGSRGRRGRRSCAGRRAPSVRRRRRSRAHEPGGHGGVGVRARAQPRGVELRRDARLGVEPQRAALVEPQHERGAAAARRPPRGAAPPGAPHARAHARRPRGALARRTTSSARSRGPRAPRRQSAQGEKRSRRSRAITAQDKLWTSAGDYHTVSPLLGDIPDDTARA